MPAAGGLPPVQTIGRGAGAGAAERPAAAWRNRTRGPLGDRSPLLAPRRELGDTCVVKTSSAGARSPEPHVTITAEGQTRSAVIALLLEHGPSTAGEISDALGMSAAGVRRHLEALIAEGRVSAGESSRYARRGRGRPAKQFRLTAQGRGRLPHAYDDLAGAAMRRLRDLGGDEAVRAFAADRIDDVVGDVEPTTPERAERDPAAVERTAARSPTPSPGRGSPPTPGASATASRSVSTTARSVMSRRSSPNSARRRPRASPSCWARTCNAWRPSPTVTAHVPRTSP